MQLRKSPFDLEKLDEGGIGAFKDYLWYSPEICNGCYSRVRSVGPKRKKMLEEPDEKLLHHYDANPPQTMEIHEWYRRTELGRQEYSSFDTNKRFGTCYCTNCGSNCTAFDEIPSKDELKEMAERIAEYCNQNTPLSVDVESIVQETDDLKSIPETDGWDTEILVVAFSRALR